MAESVPPFCDSCTKRWRFFTASASALSLLFKIAIYSDSLPLSPLIQNGWLFLDNHRLSWESGFCYCLLVSQVFKKKKKMCCYFIFWLQ
jgi:hypothetical protein